MYQAVSHMFARVKLALHEFFADESGEVNVVAIVVLIGVAVALALLFKNQISGLITTLIGTITGNANNAISTGP